jgi:hypothetical protein
MSHRFFKIVIILIIGFSLFTCIDPYEPQLRSFESRLVVDALLTDENTSNYVRLSLTTESPDDDSRVSGAEVIISDDLGNSTTLAERYPGDYRTDSLLFRGVAGRSYTLTIETSDGKRYVSDTCMLYPVPEIDSLYYGRDEMFSEETGEFRPGVTFYMDSQGENTSGYYRWSYDEWWKFNAPEPKLFEYLNDSTILPVNEVKLTCWAHRRSDVIDLEITPPGEQMDCFMKPILFVSSEESDRLLIQYCAEVKQMSLSKKEYEFWKLMAELNEAGGDIFDKQPFQIFSNISNVDDPDDPVIGYFQVSGVAQKRKYITFNEAAALDLPMYRYECDWIAKGEIDYPPPGMGKGLTFNDIYKSFINSGYTFIKPIYRDNGDLLRLVFVLPHCAECTVNGSLQKPWFWEDLY